MNTSNQNQAGCAACGGCSAQNAVGCAACPGCGASAAFPQLNRREEALMDELTAVLYLPICRFVLVPKGGDWEDGTVILSPVLLNDEHDTLEAVMDRADTLVSLALKGLLTLDFDIPLTNCTYEVFYRSDLFREFTLRFRDAPEGRPLLQRGSAAVSQAGLDVSGKSWF